jgi:hypothetical protein
MHPFKQILANQDLFEYICSFQPGVPGREWRGEGMAVRAASGGVVTQKLMRCAAFDLPVSGRVLRAAAVSGDWEFLLGLVTANGDVPFPSNTLALIAATVRTRILDRLVTASLTGVVGMRIVQPAAGLLLVILATLQGNYDMLSKLDALRVSRDQAWHACGTDAYKHFLFRFQEEACGAGMSQHAAICSTAMEVTGLSPESCEASAAAPQSAATALPRLHHPSARSSSRPAALLSPEASCSAAPQSASTLSPGFRVDRPIASEQLWGHLASSGAGLLLRHVQAGSVEADDAATILHCHRHQWELDIAKLRDWHQVAPLSIDGAVSAAAAMHGHLNIVYWTARKLGPAFSPSSALEAAIATQRRRIGMFIVRKWHPRLSQRELLRNWTLAKQKHQLQLAAAILEVLVARGPSASDSPLAHAVHLAHYASHSPMGTIVAAPTPMQSPVTPHRGRRG